MQKDTCSECGKTINLEKDDWEFSGHQKVKHEKCEQIYTMESLEGIRAAANEKFPDLKLRTIEMYPHDGGPKYKDEKGNVSKQWIYFNGMDGRTPYQWSLWKILYRLRWGE